MYSLVWFYFSRFILYISSSEQSFNQFYPHIEPVLINAFWGTLFKFHYYMLWISVEYPSQHSQQWLKGNAQHSKDSTASSPVVLGERLEHGGRKCHTGGSLPANTGPELALPGLSPLLGRGLWIAVAVLHKPACIKVLCCTSCMMAGSSTEVQPIFVSMISCLCGIFVLLKWVQCTFSPSFDSPHGLETILFKSGWSSQ